MNTDGIRYLDSAAVAAALETIDELAVVRRTLVQHAMGESLLPAEAALRWPVSADDSEARSLALPAGLVGPELHVGLKVINANPANVQRGQPRASGVLMLFDPITARIRCIMAAGRVSSRRTAAVSGVALELLSARARTVALIGAGPLAEEHVRMCATVLPALTEVRIFDRSHERAVALARGAQRMLRDEVSIHVGESAESVIRDSEVVIPVTTTTTPYIEHDWLNPHATVINVSLDDCHAEVFERASMLVVDDWGLIVHDERRMLGRLAREGRIKGPGTTGPNGGRSVDGELGTLLQSETPRPDGLCVVNPFGMGISDVALGAAVHEYAQAAELGIILDP